MQRGTNPLSKYPIRTKLILSHICIAFIPFILFGTLGIVFSLREATKNVNQYMNQTVNQINRSIDVYMTDITKAVNMMAGMIEDEGGTDSEEGKENIEKEMRRLMTSHNEIAGILYAGADEDFVSAGMTRISRDSFKKEEWYKAACEDMDKVHIISTITGRNIMTDAVYATGDVFSLAKAVKNNRTGNIDGVLLLDVRHTIIQEAIWDAWISSEGFVFVMDEYDRMVYTPVNPVVYRILPEWLVSENEPIDVKILGKSYHIRFKSSVYTGWKVVGVASTDELMGGIYRMILGFTMMLLVTLTVVVYLATWLSGMITRPVVALRNLMKETEKGDLSVRFDPSGEDEINKLGQTFNNMLEQIQMLLDKVYEEEEEKRQAQLKIVQEQFKPHFLYNTLDTINWMARDYGADDVVKLVDALTDMFRISLSKGKDYIKISEELKYISSYLYIQKIRYSEKVTYEITADDDCMDVVIPKLILQPLVENAIYHGVKLKRTPGHLYIRVEKDNDRVALSVEDDGKGMDKEQLHALSEMLQSSEKPRENDSFGLFYVKERLRLKYGSNYEIKAFSKVDEGTKIVLCIPRED